MKQSPLIFLALLFLANCGGNNNNPQPSNQGGSIVISSVTQHGYFDDTFTITGTGFNSDVTKDSVAVGYLHYDPSLKDSVFGSATGKDNMGVLQQPELISATDTEIKFKFSDPAYFQTHLNSFLNKPVVQVSSGGAKTIFHGVSFKKLFRVDFALVGGPNIPIKLGEPFNVVVTSPTTPLCTMQAFVNDCTNGCTPGDFNKCQCEPAHVIDLNCGTTQIDQNGLFLMTISPSIIPFSEKPCTNENHYQARFRFTNGDGKVFETSAWMWACKM